MKIAPAALVLACACAGPPPPPPEMPSNQAAVAGPPMPPSDWPVVTIGVARGAGLQDGAGAIGGIVVGTDGKVVADVTVSAVGPALQGTRDDITDAAGDFQLWDLPAGTYTLQLYRDYRMLDGQTEVRAGLVTQIRVTWELTLE